MFYLTTVLYPPTQAGKMVEKFQKAAAAPLPSFIKRLHTLTTSVEAGIKVVGLYEVQDDKVADGFKELLKYFHNYYDVEGFRYSVEPMLAAQEAIPLIPRW